MDISNSDCRHFNKVWEEIFKTKVKIIFDISKQKKINFKILLKELLPEATNLEYKNLWCKDYIDSI